MEEVWRGRWWTLPFLLLGSTRRVLFSSRGRNVPFTVANYAYLDRYARETVTWSRRFKFPNRYRIFDATMIHSKSRDTIVDYLGTHQHLAVDIDCHVDDEGAMCIRSSEQRFHEGRIAFRFPLLFSGVADVREWFDEDDGLFRIEVHVTNKLLGPLFGYRGAFSVPSTYAPTVTFPSMYGLSTKRHASSSIPPTEKQGRDDSRLFQTPAPASCSTSDGDEDAAGSGSPLHAAAGRTGTRAIHRRRVTAPRRPTGPSSRHLRVRGCGSGT